MQKIFVSIGSFVLAAAVLMGPADLAHAQVTEEKAESVEVLITASRFRESELDTPAHVSIISGEEIMASGKQSLAGVLENLAGVNFKSYAGPSQAQIDMRGFGENSHGRVLVMVDGRRLNSQDMQGIQWLSIPLESIERVEVVRGGNSVLYGNHAVGGVVNVVTKDSEEEYEFASTIDFGSYYSDDFENGLFSSQRLRFGTKQGAADGALTFAHSSNEGHRERTDSRSVNTRLDGGLDMTDIIRAELDLGYDWTTYEMPGWLYESQYESDPSIANDDADETEEHAIISYLSLQWFPFYNTEVNLDGGYKYQALAFDKESWTSYTDRVYNTIEASPKLTVEGETANLPWTLVTGIDTYYSAADIAKFSDKKRENKDFTSHLKLATLGAYFRPALNISRTVKLEGGLRYERAQISGKKDTEDIDERDTHQAFVYDGAFLLRPVEEAKLYARGGTLFRYPFTDEQASVMGLDDGFNDNLDPETGVNAEVGGALSIENRLSLHADGYYLLMDDEIAWYDPDGFGGTPGKNINQDKTRRWGADIAIEATLHRKAGVYCSYGLVDARFAQGDNEGNKIPLVSAHSLDAGIDLSPIEGLRISPQTRFRSEAYKSGDNDNDQDPIESYWLFDIELSYSPGAPTGEMIIKLKAENLFDEVYASFATDDSWNGNVYYPAPGRSVSLVASYSY